MPAFDTLSALPASMTSGETITWTESQPDYADPAYLIAYNFGGQTPVDGYQTFSVTGVGTGTSWTYTITSASAPKPGLYAWQKIVTRASPSAKIQIACGTFTIRPNLAVAQTTSSAATQLAALNVAITTLSSGQFQSVSLNGQSFTKRSINELYRMRTDLEAAVIREQNALAALSGIGRDRNVKTVFQNQ